MSGLRVEHCGPGTSVQDWGRTGWRRFGVPTSGAMDRLALAHANALVGNHPGEAAVEFMLQGGQFTVTGGPVLLAVSGPGARLSVAGEGIPPGSGARAEPGDQIAVRDVRGGVFAYLAFGGGLALDLEMGSRSLHRRSGIGGKPVSPGDGLEVRDPDAAERRPRKIPVPALPSGPVRVIPGPQEDYFAPESGELLVSAPYRVSPRSDRMGCRLQGRPLVHRAGFNIISDGVLAGAIQVPGDGQPLVLFRDGPTTGGYPKIATVISADVDRLAQVPPGAIVRLANTDLQEAASAARSLRRVIGQLSACASGGGMLRGEDLMTANLIGGVVDAMGFADPPCPVAERDETPGSSA